MNRIDRLQAILTTLQSRRVVTAETLARKYEVSLRTIYRDIRSLEEGGVPIGAEAGIGYYIPEGYSLPPVMFTHAEARTLLLASKVLEQMTDARTSKLFAEALTKISAVLDTSKKEELEDLESKILVQPQSGKDQFSLQEEVVLEKIKEALVKNQRVSFEYISAGRSESTTRRIDPIGLCYYGHYWHVIGFCHLRNNYRDFRTDRMSLFMVLQERFRPSEHPSVKQYMEKWICDKELTKIVINVHQSVLKQVLTTRYSMGFIHERTEGEWTEMEFATWSIPYFARWVLLMVDQVQIMHPPELLNEVTKTVNLLSHFYLAIQNHVQH